MARKRIFEEEFKSTNKTNVYLIYPYISRNIQNVQGDAHNMSYIALAFLCNCSLTCRELNSDGENPEIPLNVPIVNFSTTTPMGDYTMRKYVFTLLAQARKLAMKTTLESNHLSPTISLNDRTIPNS